MKETNFSFLTYLALGVIILGYTVTFGFPKKMETVPLSKTQIIEATPTPRVLSSEYLVGIWQDSPVMASGWGEHYNFYPSGAFQYFSNGLPNGLNCKTKEIDTKGTWKLTGNIVELTIIEKITNSFKCDSTGLSTPIGSKKVKLPKPESGVFSINLAELTEGYEYYESIWIDGKQWWKLQIDPTGGGVFPE